LKPAGLDLLLLDSSVHGKPHGELDVATLQWLGTRRLPPRQTGPRYCSCITRRSKPASGHMDRQNLLNAGELAPIVRRHPRVLLIATGHGSSRDADDVPPVSPTTNLPGAQTTPSIWI